MRRGLLGCARSACFGWSLLRPDTARGLGCDLGRVLLAHRWSRCRPCGLRPGIALAVAFLRLIVLKELPPRRVDRLTVLQVLLVDLVDEPLVRAEHGQRADLLAVA